MKEQKWLKVLENFGKSKKEKISEYANEDRLGDIKLRRTDYSYVCIQQQR